MTPRRMGLDDRQWGGKEEEMNKTRKRKRSWAEWGISIGTGNRHRHRRRQKDDNNIQISDFRFQIGEDWKSEIYCNSITRYSTSGSSMINKYHGS